MNRIEQIIKAAQEYDYANRPHPGNWSRVPDPQVLRLLIGAGAIKPPEHCDDDQSHS